MNDAQSGSSVSTLYQPTDVKTTSDQKIAEPTTPAAPGARFTGWYTVRGANGQSNKYDFNKSVDANFKDATGVVTLYAGWDTTNVSRIQLNLNYRDDYGFQSQGIIIEYVEPGSTVTLPAGLEEYYQTDAQADSNKGEYTTSKLKGWKYGTAGDIVTSVKAPAEHKSTILDAAWSDDAAYLLDANGGKFADGSTSQWATIEDGAAIKFPVPTRAGYTFGAWQNKTTGYVLNSANGQYYQYNDKFENFFDINSKPVTGLTIQPGDQFKALWWSGAVQVTKATYDFNGVLKYENVEKDYAAVEAAGYTKASAKSFVDAQYALRDEYAAYTGLKTGSQAQIDAAVKLNAKYDAAKALLV
ncbi:InlB B-repeat-containing protein, partial [Bifidobacterium callitrichos]